MDELEQAFPGESYWAVRWYWFSIGIHGIMAIIAILSYVDMDAYASIFNITQMIAVLL